MMNTFVFDAYGTLYDTHSVAAATEDAFPGHGEAITLVWRLKQLEYTWLRSLMGCYRDFWDITRESLTYTLENLGLPAEAEAFDHVLDTYLHLSPYPETIEALQGLRDDGHHQLAILSNGSQQMLDSLVRNTGVDSLLDSVISVDPKQAFKPSPAAYSLVREKLGATPNEVIFVSSNPFDACGAKNHGFKVAWIERVSAASLQAELQAEQTLGAGTLFKLLRMRMDHLGFAPDAQIHSLSDLSTL